jgi:cytochrome P450
MLFLDHLRAALTRFSHYLSGREASPLPGESEAPAEVLRTVREALAEAGEDVEQFANELKSYGAAHPREVFSILRRLQPILITKKLAIVTRFRDVQEVLTRDDAFDVPYAERMRLLTDDENFFLGMQDTPRYARDHANTTVAVRREDVSSVIIPFVEKVAGDIVSRAPGKLDVVAELTQIVPARLVGSYFGTPGPSEREMIEWASALFWFLFLDQAEDPAVRARALAASNLLNAYVERAIAERRERPTDRDDVLGRALALQVARIPGTRDLDIRNNLTGLIIGAIPTTATASALILDELLRRPRELEDVQAAARANDHDLVARYAFEALRFNPMTPGIFRIANRAITVAKGERHETAIAAGTKVVAAIESAMFDDREIDEPENFRLDRSPRDYLHFGHGLHACFGRHINQVQIPGLLMPLLKRKNLRRDSGDAGLLRKSGPFATSLTVLFD